ncbi:hypothetical protein SAMN05444267_10735 [Chryseobacterium polytrichastri]|uniref:C1q domain-containing protein n=2 Tax=Chryseobacterium polytrichastri TaxID=1302687 RepID=A0A1M7KUR5_9FLAO|nr:hypothetical protein SAMN05444267_10735 [Chryseobacterium polytrichastri]
MIIALFPYGLIIFGQVGIGTSTPNSSAILDVNVDNLAVNAKKGLLIPKVALNSAIDVSTIPSPANGLLIFNTTLSGVVPNQVLANSYYKYNTTKSRWELMVDENSLAALSIPSIASIIGFKTTGNDTTYLSADLGSSIRQVLYDDIRVQSTIATYDTTTSEFIANKAGYYDFQVNLVARGPYNGTLRFGVSRPYTGPKPTSLSNANVAFLSMQTYNIDGGTPLPMHVSGIIFMNAGDKVIFLTRFVDPTVNTLNVEAINYSRTYLNSVDVTYFSN